MICEIPKAVGDWPPDLMPAFQLVRNFSILARRLQCENFRTLRPSRQSWQWTKLAVDFECRPERAKMTCLLLIFTSETDNELPKASTQRPIHSYLVSNFTCAEAVASRRTVRFSGSHSHCGISSALCARTTLFEIFYMGRWSRLLGTRCVLMHFLCLTGALLVFVPGLRQYFCDVSRSKKAP